MPAELDEEVRCGWRLLIDWSTQPHTKSSIIDHDESLIECGELNGLHRVTAFDKGHQTLSIGAQHQHHPRSQLLLAKQLADGGIFSTIVQVDTILALNN